MEMIKFNYMLEIDILRNSSPKKVGVLTGAFEGFGCPKRHPDALLAKTMPSTLKSQYPQGSPFPGSQGHMSQNLMFTK